MFYTERDTHNCTLKTVKQQVIVHKKNPQRLRIAMCSSNMYHLRRGERKYYLDGGNVKRRCYSKHWHDHCFILFINEDLHIPNVLLTRHLGHILVGHI